MKAMILAAGLGNRMRPLTDHCPKPLLKVAGKPLIEHQINRLVAAGITDITINHAYLGEQIEAYLQDGRELGCRIRYSRESTPLETGGGIFQALPLLGDEPFLLINGDIWLDADLPALMQAPLTGLAHLVMVANPEHHPVGDFKLHNGLLQVGGEGQACTYSGLAILSPKLFDGCEPGVFKLAPLLVAAMVNQQVQGSYFDGYWLDVGTPQRLAELEQHIQDKTC